MGAILVILYLGCIAALVIHLLTRIGQFVRAQDRVAGALEEIAQSAEQNLTRFPGLYPARRPRWVSLGSSHSSSSNKSLASSHSKRV